jgi:multiple sugar transport system substrate-binding protein
MLLSVLIVFLFCGELFAAGEKQQQQQSTAETGSQPVEITFWDDNAGPDRTPYLEQIIQKYHEAQNKVRVKYVGVPQTQMVDKVNMAVAGNAVPDISGMRPSWVSGLIAQNAMMKLDDVFNAWPDSKQYDPAAIKAIRQRDINGGLYLLPIRVTYSCIWYRIDRFKEKGVPVPQTWDEFFTAIEKLTDPAKGEYGFAMRGGQGSASQLQVFMFAYSGRKGYIDQNGVSAFRDPAMLEFLTRYAGIYKKYTAAGDVNNTYQAMVAAFDSSTANIIQHNLGSLGEHKKNLPAGTFGTFMYPKSKQGYYCILEPSFSGYAVYEGSKHKEEAVDFLKWLGNEENLSFWNETIGEFPPRFDVQKHEWVQKADHLKNIVPVMQDTSTIFVEPAQYLPEYNRILTQLAEPGFQAVLLGQKTPAAFLDEWAGAVEEAYKRFQANRPVSR